MPEGEHRPCLACALLSKHVLYAPARFYVYLATNRVATARTQAVQATLQNRRDPLLLGSLHGRPLLLAAHKEALSVPALKVLFPTPPSSHTSRQAGLRPDTRPGRARLPQRAVAAVQRVLEALAAQEAAPAALYELCCEPALSPAGPAVWMLSAASLALSG
jgi:hypothetical protein